MVISLLLCISPLWMAAPFQLLLSLHFVSFISPWHWPPQRTPFPTVPLLLHVDCCHKNLFVCDCHLGMALHATLLPPYGHSPWLSYRYTAISSFLRAVLAISVTGLTFLPVPNFSWWLLCNRSCCSHLKTAHPKRLPDKVPVSPGVLPVSFFRLLQAKVPRVVNAPSYMALTLSLMVSSFI
jgi:hypothetical protein